MRGYFFSVTVSHWPLNLRFGNVVYDLPLVNACQMITICPGDARTLSRKHAVSQTRCCANTRSHRSIIKMAKIAQTATLTFRSFYVGCRNLLGDM